MADVVVEARGLTKRYDHDCTAVDVLRGIDLSVRAGEFVAILGPSGSGKSTLLNLLGLMDRPTGGAILLSGRPTGDLSEDERAQRRNSHLGFVFQFDALMSEFTIMENVLMPARIAASPKLAAESRARTLLETLGVAPQAERMPRELSGGERQRAALARALMNAPSVLLADEPTGNLDRPNAELVFSKLKELAETFGVAVVMVTHNEQAVGYANRAIRLKDGRIAE